RDRAGDTAAHKILGRAVHGISGLPGAADHQRSKRRHSPYKSRQGARFSAGGRPRMTTETEAPRERLRPRILETEETGRLELSLQQPPEALLPVPRTQQSRSPIR